MAVLIFNFDTTACVSGYVLKWIVILSEGYYVDVFMIEDFEYINMAIKWVTSAQ